MTFDWTAFAPTAAAAFDGSDIRCFGDAGAELAATAAGDTVLAPLTHLGVISCLGEDAKGFLHNQLTSDVNHLNPGHAQHAAWCTAKGRMLASFIVLRADAGYLLQLSADLLPAMLKRFQMYVLRAKVKLADSSATHVLVGVAGRQAEAALTGAGLPVPSAALAVAEFHSGRVLRLADDRFEVLMAADAAPGLWTALSRTARPVGTPAWRWLDIQAALPLVTERTKEEFVPQMANFDQLGGVSFHKGCYPGQEVVARTQYLGKVKRHLYRVAAAQPLAAGDALFSPAEPDHACGMIVNAAPAPAGGFEALAVLQESGAAGPVTVGARDGLLLSAINPVAA